MGPLTVPRFYIFNSAHYVVDRCLLTTGDGCGERVRITTTWSVLVHEEGVVLLDTGVTREAIGAAGSDDHDVPIMHRGQELPAALARIGLEPADVRYVVNTHLHGDHVGGNVELPGAVFVVQRAELEYAQDPDIPSMVAEYSLDALALERLSYECIDGDLDLFGDGVVRLLSTPGHTPGHQSVLLRLPETGSILVAGDAIWTAACLDEMQLPSVLWFASAFVTSRRRLLDLQEREGARWLFSHEPSTFDEGGWVEAAAHE